MAVIETTMVLDPIKDKWMVDSLLTRPDWKIKSQTTTSITFYQFWQGELMQMPVYALKGETDNG